MKEFLTNVRLAILFMRPGVRKFAFQVLRGEVATGLSSHALATHALGVNPNFREKPPFCGRPRPRDPGDYGRCIEAYVAAPKILQRRMKPIMDQWREDLMNLDYHPYPASQLPEAPDPYPKVFGRWN